MRRAMLAAAISLCATAWAADYRLDAGVQARDGSLKVEPTVSGPAGKTVRYEIQVRREGAGNNSDSSQSGRARLDDSGRAKLASTSVSLRPNERYEVEVTLFEGQRLVAREHISH
jgi:hypothetical protein